MTDTRSSNHNVKETGKEARQGPLGKPILYVLIGGLLLALIAWGGAELFGEGTDNSATITEQENPAAGQNKPSDQATPPSGDQPTTNPPVENARPQTGTGGGTQANPPSATPQ
ncbi:hypothetical protein V9K92_17000 [Phyllobacterium sp. CCNWLW109]|uniref:hypothetical protein n=1 Tax=Phyllobacterium sp. CCNWLW109 TaxID=3127479 RepID=UPI003076CCC9